MILCGLLPAGALAQSRSILFDSPASGIPSASYNTGALATGTASGQNGWVAGSSTSIPSSAQIGVVGGGFSGNQAVQVTGNGTDLRDATLALSAVGGGFGTTTSGGALPQFAGLISVRLKYKKGTVINGAGVLIKPQTLDDAAGSQVFGFFQILGNGTMFGRGGAATTTVTDTVDPASFSGNGFPNNGWHELELRLNPNDTDTRHYVMDPATNTQVPFGFVLYIINGNKVPGVNNPMLYYGGNNTSHSVGRFTFRREVGSNATTASAFFDDWQVWAHPRPAIQTQAITVTLSAAGSYTLSATDLNNLAAGSVGGDEMQSITGRSSSPNTFSCASAIGSGVNTVTVTVTQSDGQTNSKTSTVTVLRPGSTVTCQAGTLSRALSGGSAVFSVSDIKATSSAGSICSSISSEQVKKSTALDATYASSVSFDCTELGDRAVTLRVTQNDGQVQTCTRNVTITEPAPSAICKNISVPISGGTVTVNAADVNNGSAAGGGCTPTLAIANGDQTSSCSSATFAPSVSFDCNDLGPQTVTLRVGQPDGQTACCTAVVTVTGSACPRSIAAWRSARDHTGIPDLAIPLNASATGNGATGPTVETRSGGVRRIELDFDGSVSLLDPSGVTCTARVTTDGSMGPPTQPTPSQVYMLDPDTMIIQFDQDVLPSDQACITITVAPTTIGENLTGDTDCNIRVVEGDVTGDGAVNLSDAVYTKMKADASDSAAANPAFDVDMSGGDIDLGDIQQTKAGVGSPTKLALCP